MKLNIVGKMFVSILSIFLFVMFFQIVFQEFLLDPIYKITKEHEITKAFNSVVSNYINRAPLDIEEYFDATEAYLSFVDYDGKIKAENFLTHLNFIEIDGQKIIFEGLFDDMGDLYNNTFIETGHSVTVEGRPIKGTDYFLGYKLTVGNNVYFSSLRWRPAEGETNLQTDVLSGTVTRMKGHDRSDGTLGYQAIRMVEEINHILNEMNDSNSIQSAVGDRQIYEFVDENSGLNYGVLVKIIEGTQNVLAISLFEIAELGRAFAIISRYYYYLFALQILLVIGLALLYSRWFTRPLLELNKNARAIASEDFSNRTAIESGDELEELSDNINMIAGNLAKSMANLENHAKEKEESEERMRRLLMDMSHEFKTPLGIMSGFIEIITDGVNEKPVEYYLKNIASELEGLDELVRNTLELTRLESKGNILKKSEVDLKEIIETSLEKFEIPMNEKSLTVETQLCSCRTAVDRQRMIRVMNNLISNAVKYSPADGKIYIHMNRETEGCHISVINSAESFTSDDKAKMFDRYYRGDSSRNRSTGGHGLGLSIVKNILEQHNFPFTVDYNNSQVCIRFFMNMDT